MHFPSTSASWLGADLYNVVFLNLHLTSFSYFRSKVLRTSHVTSASYVAEANCAVVTVLKVGSGILRVYYSVEWNKIFFATELFIPRWSRSRVQICSYGPWCRSGVFRYGTCGIKTRHVARSDTSSVRAEHRAQSLSAYWKTSCHCLTGRYRYGTWNRTNWSWCQIATESAACAARSTHEAAPWLRGNCTSTTKPGLGLTRNTALTSLTSMNDYASARVSHEWRV